MPIPTLLTDYERNVLTRARQLIPTEPPEPWRYVKAIEAPPLIAAGWTPDEKLVLISWDGYSITIPDSGERLLLSLDWDIVNEHLTENRLRFRIPNSKTTINIFGVDAGDGIRVSNYDEDRWLLNIIYPWWPRKTVVLQRSVLGNQDRWEKTTALKLHLITDVWMKCGFSPSGKYFIVIGSQGAELFARK